MNLPWAVITGASSGIGWATARSLAREGYHLCLLARREERLKDLLQEIKKEHANIDIKIASVDVRKSREVSDFFRSQGPCLNQVKVLINNAGLAKGADVFQDGKPEDWDLMIDTNLRGVLNVTRALLPIFIKNNCGHIVNLGSVAGRWTYPGGAVYSATKFAIRAFSDSLRMDLLGKNIRVTNIEPGMVNTEFSKVRFDDQAKADKVYQNMTPLSADDIAECIAWSLKRPAHVNIQEMVVFPTDQAAIQMVHRHKGEM